VRYRVKSVLVLNQRDAVLVWHGLPSGIKVLLNTGYLLNHFVLPPDQVLLEETGNVVALPLCEVEPFDFNLGELLAADVVNASVARTLDL